MVLRRTAPDLHRPLGCRLNVLPAGLCARDLMIYWAAGRIPGDMLLLILPIPVYLYYRAARQDGVTSAATARGVVVDWPISRRRRRPSLGRKQRICSRDYISYAGTSYVWRWPRGFCRWGVRSGWRTPSVEA